MISNNNFNHCDQPVKNDECLGISKCYCFSCNLYLCYACNINSHDSHNTTTLSKLHEEEKINKENLEAFFSEKEKEINFVNLKNLYKDLENIKTLRTKFQEHCNKLNTSSQNQELNTSNQILTSFFDFFNEIYKFENLLIDKILKNRESLHFDLLKSKFSFILKLKK